MYDFSSQVRLPSCFRKRSQLNSLSKDLVKPESVVVLGYRWHCRIVSCRSREKLSCNFSPSFSFYCSRFVWLSLLVVTYKIDLQFAHWGAYKVTLVILVFNLVSSKDYKTIATSAQIQKSQIDLTCLASWARVLMVDCHSSRILSFGFACILSGQVRIDLLILCHQKKMNVRTWADAATSKRDIECLNERTHYLSNWNGGPSSKEKVCITFLLMRIRLSAIPNQSSHIWTCTDSNKVRKELLMLWWCTWTLITVLCSGAKEIWGHVKEFYQWQHTSANKIFLNQLMNCELCSCMF